MRSVTCLLLAALCVLALTAGGDAVELAVRKHHRAIGQRGYRTTQQRTCRGHTKD